MPLITISMYPGRTQQQKDDFANIITKSAVEILKTKEKDVIVVFNENPKRKLVLSWRTAVTFFYLFYGVSFYFELINTLYVKNCSYSDEGIH